MNLTIEIPPNTMTASAFSSPRGSESLKQNKSRCETCRKKLGIVNFQCKCGGHYCSEHRVSENHTCQYNYQAEYKKLLSTTLVKVVGAKIDMI